MTLTLIIPAHNEEEIIAETLRSIENSLKLEYKIIVINDHSTDNTAGIVCGLMKEYANLKLIDNDGPRGFGNTLKKGFSVTDSDLVIPVMADLCDDPETIEKMYAEALKGADVVCGSRYIKGGTKIGGPFIQSFASRFVGCSLHYLIGIPTFDVSNSYKCYRKAVLEAIKIESNGFAISMEITLKAFFAGFKISEVPTVWRGRSIGNSKFYLFKVAPEYVKFYFWAIFLQKGKRKWLK